MSFFNNRFLISLFEAIYTAHVRLKPITFYSLDDKLYRKNRKRDSQKADEILHEIHQKLCRELVFRPLRSPTLPENKDYFRIANAPQWLTSECVRSRLYNIEGKIDIHVRSYGSLSSKEGESIFLINNREECGELTELMKEEGLSEGLIEKATSDKMKKSTMIEITLRQNRYFSTVMPWYVRGPCKRVRGDARWTNTLRESV